MSLMPNPEDYSSFDIDDGLVVVRENRHRLYVLNSTARRIWENFLQGYEPGRIASKLVEEYGIPQDTALGDVNDALENWRTEGLLSGENGDQGSDGDALEDKVTQSVSESASCFSEYTYEMLGVTFKIRYCHQMMERQVHPRLRSYVSSGATARHTLEIAKDGADYLIFRDGEHVLSNRSMFEATGIVFEELISILYPGVDWLMFFHAAAIGDGERCVLLPADNGCGKSTLTATLVHYYGFEYFSDDIVPLTLDGPGAVPLPIDICLKEGSWAVISKYLPQIEKAHTLNLKGWKARFIPQGRNGGIARRAPAPIKSIVFPRYSPGKPPELVPLSQIDTFQRIASSKSRIPADPLKVEKVVNWVKTTPAYALGYDSLEDAKKLIGKVFDE